MRLEICEPTIVVVFPLVCIAKSRSHSGSFGSMRFAPSIKKSSNGCMRAWSACMATCVLGAEPKLEAPVKFLVHLQDTLLSAEGLSHKPRPHLDALMG